MVAEDVTLNGKYTKQYTDNISYDYTPEIYINLSSNVTTKNLIKKIF